MKLKLEQVKYKVIKILQKRNWFEQRNENISIKAIYYLHYMLRR